jgi:hypothetical protein
MAFDSARGRTVLFGGQAGASTVNDTWEWDGADWTQIQDVGPSPRSRTALAFDSNRGRSVLFGGQGAGGAFGDTWEWDGSDWTQVEDVGPSARSGHATVFDSDGQRTLLFGGRAGGGLTGDTWQWDGNAWTQVEDSGPPVRELHGMAYATDRKRTVLFGGAAANGSLGDTWEWDGTRWTHLQDVGPTRQGLAMAFKGASVVLFGGSSGAQANPPAVLGDTWDWDGHHWTERQDMGPEARWLHALACDSARGQLVLFGGTSTLPGDRQLGDTWEASGDSGAGPGNVALVSFDVVEGPKQAVGGQQVVLVGGDLGLSAAAPPKGVEVLVSVPGQAGAGGIPLVTQDGQNINGPPWSVPIPGGSSSTTFEIEIQLIPGQTLTFTASLGGVTKTASVTIS